MEIEISQSAILARLYPNQPTEVLPLPEAKDGRSRYSTKTSRADLVADDLFPAPTICSECVEIGMEMIAEAFLESCRLLILNSNQGRDRTDPAGFFRAPTKGAEWLGISAAIETKAVSGARI